MTPNVLVGELQLSAESLLTGIQTLRQNIMNHLPTEQVHMDGYMHKAQRGIGGGNRGSKH